VLVPGQLLGAPFPNHIKLDTESGALSWHTASETWNVLFDRFVGEVAERIEEYSSGSFVGISGSCECNLKFRFGHVRPLFMAAQWQHCKRIADPRSPLTLKINVKPNLNRWRHDCRDELVTTHYRRAKRNVSGRKKAPTFSAILKTYRGSCRKSMGDPKGIRTRFNRSLEKKAVFLFVPTTHSIEK
jgi:hypothetical protein